MENPSLKGPGIIHTECDTQEHLTAKLEEDEVTKGISDRLILSESKYSGGAQSNEGLDEADDNLKCFVAQDEEYNYDSDSSFTCIYKERNEINVDDVGNGDLDDLDDDDDIGSRYYEGIFVEESESFEEDEDTIDGLSIPRPRPLTGSGHIDFSLGPLDFAQLMNQNVPNLIKEMVQRQFAFTGKMKKLQDFRDQCITDLKYSQEDVELLFPNLDMVVSYHAKLEEELRRELSENPFSPRVGFVYKHIVPFLRSHDEMCTKLERCSMLITTWAKKDEKFKQKVEKFEKTGPRIPMCHFYQEPFKYLVDMKEIFKRYLRKMEETSKDKGNSQETVQAFEDVLTNINGTRRFQTQSERLLTLKPEFAKKGLDIMEARRSLEVDGKTAGIFNPRNGHFSDVEAFLFNDVLVLCSPNLEKAKPGSLQVLDMTDSFVIEEDTKFIIYTRRKVLDFRISGTKRHRKDWLEALKEINKRSGRTLENTEFDGSRAPRMLFVEVGGKCANKTCEKVITRRTFVRHCACCGKVFCRSCCASEATLKYCPEKGARKVCKECSRKLKIQST